MQAQRHSRGWGDATVPPLSCSVIRHLSTKYRCSQNRQIINQIRWQFYNFKCLWETMIWDRKIKWECYTYSRLFFHGRANHQPISLFVFFLLQYSLIETAPPGCMGNRKPPTLILLILIFRIYMVWSAMPPAIPDSH